MMFVSQLQADYTDEKQSQLSSTDEYNELRDDAFNINKVEDKVFCLKPSSNIYERLDGNWLDKINSEEAGY